MIPMRARSYVPLAPLLLAALMLAPIAHAGTEDDPEIIDPVDVRDGWSPPDVLSAWFEHDPRGVRFSIKTVDGSMPERYPDFVYWVAFRAGGVTSSAAVGFDGRGRFLGHVGPLDGPAWTRGGFETVANGKLVGLEQDRGRPSVWSGVIPWGAVPGLEEGATLIDLQAGSAWYNREAGQWQGGIDRARSDRAFVARPHEDPPAHPLVAGAVVGATTAGGAAAGWLLQRRRPET